MTNEAGTEKKADTKKRPGTRLMVTGLAILALGILLVIVGFSTTHMEMVPGTFRTKEVPGAPTPAAWIILLIGVVLSAVGFGRRVLASIEK
jgi:hypothetical protein